MEQQVVKYRLADPGIRFLARLIDVVLFYVSIMIGFAYLSFNSMEVNDLLIFPVLVFPLLLAILQFVFLTLRGQTLGKMLLKIRIVRADTGENGGFVTNVLLRTILNSIIAVVPFYGLIDSLFIFGEDNRCLHDKIAGTVVCSLKNPLVVNSYIPNEPYEGFEAGTMNNIQAPPQFYQPKSKNNNTILYIILGGIGGIFVLAIVAAIAINMFGGVINSAKQKAELQDTWFNSYDNSFKIKATKNWVNGNGALNKDADLIINSKDGQQYIMVIKESKSELPANFDMEGYEKAVSDTKKQIDEFKDKDFISLNINEFEARQISYVYEVEGIKLGYLLTLIETNEGFYQVYAWTEESGFERYKLKLQDIVNSFELI